VVWTTAGFIGPPLGGFLVDGPGWRFMFYLNVPTAIAALLALQWGYRIPRKRIEHAVDFLGALLLFTSVGSLILYTSWAGEFYGWISLPALSIFGLSVVLAVAFVYQEKRAAEPILELSLLGRRAIWPPLLATCIFGFANFAIAFFIPLFGIVVRGESTVQAGFALAPLTAGLLVSGIIVGRRAAATQRYRRYASFGMVLYLIGLALLVTADGETSTAAFLFYNLLLGMGSGALTPVVVAAIQHAVEERQIGVASSLPGFSRAIAQTIGTSVLGSLLAIRIGVHLRQDVASIAPPGVNLNDFIESPDAVRALSGPLETAVVEAYRAAFAETFFVMIVVMLAALVATRFMRDPEDDRDTERQAAASDLSK
jgi:MFS family permease